MARVMTFFVKDAQNFGGVPDKQIENFITDCEKTHYVNVVCCYVPIPTPRVTVIVTNLDVREQQLEQDIQIEPIKVG